MRTRLLAVLFAICSLPIINTYAQEKVTCPRCNGSGSTVERCTSCRNGSVPCSKCDMAGTIRERCTNCSGGYVSRTVNKTCYTCGGRRSVPQTRQIPCTCRNGKRPTTSRGGNVIYVDCSRCSGRGYKEERYSVTCRTCGGTGYSGTETKTERCSYCTNGYTTTTCSRCNGARGTMCTKCSGYANIKVNCSRCSGYGVIYVSR